jgi:protein-S-isoprenylcysteine O-methyltransferase Ste14
MIGALVWLIAAGIRLGPNLTPLPYPKSSGTLVETGVYALVRHPMYCGAICAAVGWSLWVQGVLTVGYAVVLVVFLDAKASREERWLRAKFPEYAAYAQRVRKLIPFVY